MIIWLLDFTIGWLDADIALGVANRIDREAAERRERDRQRWN